MDRLPDGEMVSQVTPPDVPDADALKLVGVVVLTVSVWELGALLA